MQAPDRSQAIIRGLPGAVADGFVGDLTFFWVARQGFYGLIIPPGLLGSGTGICARRRSVPLAAVCGVAGLALALFTEWKLAPFIVDGSFAYFITHLQALEPVTLLMLVLGAFLSDGLTLGFDRKPNPPA